MRIIGIFGTHPTDIYRCGLCLARFPQAAAKALHLIGIHDASLDLSDRGYRYEADVPATHRLATAAPVDRDDLR